MANSKDQDYARISVYSKRDPSTNEYDIPPIEKDIRNIVNNYIKSALPKDAFVQVENKKIYKTGRERVDIYIHKEDVSPALLQSLNSVETSLVFDKDPRYMVTKPKPASHSVTDELRKMENAPDVHAYVKEKEKKDKEIAREEARKQKEAEQARIREQRELDKLEKERQAQENEDKKAIRGLVLKIFGVVTVVADVTRRILSSVLTFATQSTKDMLTAHNLGMSYDSVLNYRHTERRHGLEEGTITGGVADVQNKFGNITSLDEKALESLAVVMGDKVNEMVNVATSEQNPEKALGMIIDAFNQQANAGYNSVGQYVGEANARRELYSYLLKLSPQWADIFATMQEEQHNINSIFRNQADTFEQWKNLTPPPRSEPSKAQKNVLAETGQQWNVFKETMDSIKESLLMTIAPTLLHVLRFLSNLRIGMSEAQKERLNRENYEKNLEFIKKTEKTLASMESYGIQNLTPEQQARYTVLTEAKAKAEKANQNTRQIDEYVLLEEDEQLAVELELKRKAKAKAEDAKYAVMNNLNKEMTNWGESSEYQYLPEATPERIASVLSGYPALENKAREAYEQEKKNREANQATSQEKTEEARQEAYNRKYNELVAKPERDREAWIDDWYIRNSDDTRIEEAEKEAERAISDPYKYGLPSEASKIGYWGMYKTVYMLSQLYGIDFLHDEQGNQIPLKEAISRIKGKDKYKGQPVYYTGDISKSLKKQKLQEPLPERTMPAVPAYLDIDYDSIRQQAKEYAETTVPYTEVEELPDFYTWIYRYGKLGSTYTTTFFNKAIMELIAKEQQVSSENDIFRAIDIFNQEYGGDPAKLQAKVGETYNISGATISSRNEKQASGVNRYVLELNVKTKEGDKTFTIFDKYGMEGFAGKDWGTVDASGEGWSLTNLNGQGMSNSGAQGD